MNVFFKDRVTSFFISNRDLPVDTPRLQKVFRINPSIRYNLGIDASTTSFGVSWYQSKNEASLLQLMRGTDETGPTFMEKVFPFLQLLFRSVVFDTITYERTPDDFVSDSRAIRIMKQTEASVKAFVDNPYYVEVSHKHNIFDIFPISWKAYMVDHNIDKNPNKVNKRENAISVLNRCGVDPTVWLNELDKITGHDYDCAEALGIAVYGAEFLHSEPFIRTYRNFGRRRSLSLVGKLVDGSVVHEEIEAIASLVNFAPICMYIPNEYHSAFENIYALDGDDRFGILLTETRLDVRPYLEHIHGIVSDREDEVLISMSFRNNALCNDVITKLCQYRGFQLLQC